MKPENAFEIVRFNRKMDARPGHFDTKEGTTASRLRRFGKRFFDISEQDKEELGHQRTFTHTFKSDDDIELTLEMGAYYSYEGKSPITPNHAYHMWAIWKEGDEVLREERIYEGFEERNNDDLQGDEITAMVNRLEESLVAAESIHAEEQATATV